MPTSWYQAIPLILHHVEREQPQSILDVGVGFGKYGFLMREILEIPFERYHKQQWKIRIDGVEAFETYMTPVHDYVYDRIYYGNVVELVDHLPSYDVVLLIDVLEHFSKDEGLYVIHKLLERTNKALIVSTPIYPDLQEEYLGNSFKEHKSRWSLIDFVDFDFTYHELPIGDNGAHILKFYPSNRFSHHSDFEKDTMLRGNVGQRDVCSLTITYVLPHNRLTGGLKMLIEQMRHLKKRGHIVQVALRGNDGDRVIPDWIEEVDVDKEILVPDDLSFLPYIKNSDVIVAGWVGQLKELNNDQIPVFYWEQGHEWLFGEISNPEMETQVRQHLLENYTQPVAIASVSPVVARILYTRYRRVTPVLPNYIDTSLFHPLERPREGETILLVGNPALRFKGFNVAFRALELVRQAGYSFKVKWVTPVPVQFQSHSFPIEVIVRPSQNELASIYRKSDMLLFPSWYEGFGMPPLEAMASGVPVVATRCGGVETYAKHGENALLFEPGDYKGLAAGIMYFLKNKEARRVFAQKGRETALQFDFAHGIQLVEQYLRNLVHNFRSRKKT